MDVIARAEELAELLRADDGPNATTVPGEAAALLTGKGVILVSPLPSFGSGTLENEYLLSWELVAMVSAPGNKTAAKRLTDLVQHAIMRLPIVDARPVSYALVEGQDPFPAYVMTLEE